MPFKYFRVPLLPAARLIHYFKNTSFLLYILTSRSSSSYSPGCVRSENLYSASLLMTNMEKFLSSLTQQWKDGNERAYTGPDDFLKLGSCFIISYLMPVLAGVNDFIYLLQYFFFTIINQHKKT